MTTDPPDPGTAPDPGPVADSGSASDSGPAAPRVGDQIELDIGPVAHGGHCVARWDNRVVFVRHALPGERALVRLTDTSHAGYFRGDAVEILTADLRRVPPRCVHFVPGGCGGCDFQHADGELQRELKAAVVVEQLARLAGIDRVVTVEALPGTGFGWRTRVRWALDEAGRIGPRAVRSHQVVPVSAAEPCEIAADGLSEMVAMLDVPRGVRGAPGGRHSGRSAGGRGGSTAGRRRGSTKLPEVTLLRPPDGDPMAVWDSRFAPVITETAAGRDFSVAGDGFWQVHPAAAETLYAAVSAALDGVPLTGGRAWDLYGGVGLFAALLAERVGPAGGVVSVESEAAATDLAKENLADLPQCRVLTGRVNQLLDDLGAEVDAVVLDPPRSGAGRAICAAVAERSPKVIVYVACDPAALARDTAILADTGYRLDTLRAFDCFPQTHHVECVARFVPA